MRNILILATALSIPVAAWACVPIPAECLPEIVVFPAYTPEGLRVGTVEARVAQPPLLEPSRYTGQPRTVLFNDPARLPGAVDPVLTLVPLPHVRHRYDTVGAYPSGY